MEDVIEENTGLIANWLFRLRQTDALVSDLRLIAARQMLGHTHCVAKTNDEGTWDVQQKTLGHSDAIIATNIDLQGVFSIFVDRVNMELVDTRTRELKLLKPGDKVISQGFVHVSVQTPETLIKGTKDIPHFASHREFKGYEAYDPSMPN